MSTTTLDSSPSVHPRSDERRPAVTLSAALEERLRRRPVLVAVPLYHRPDLALQVLASLASCVEEIAALDGEVLLYNDSPDDPVLDATLRDALTSAPPGLRLRVERNVENLGFVRTANLAISEAVRRGHDLLLLNSDTVLTSGALTEMVRVASVDPMIGFVNPRSNNATLASLPHQVRFQHLPPADARAAWETISPRLPPFSYAPTANGFCILIRYIVLAEFGGLDEIYGRGYNEENDLVMRAGRRGYRAVLANHAFVWHEGSASFGLNDEREGLERNNRQILLARYPEYSRLVQTYFESAEQRAELLLGALIPDANGRFDVALDFSSFVPAHNGTFTAGLQLLAAAAGEWRDRFNLSILCAEDCYAFHDMGRFGAPCRDPHGPEVYAAIFRVGQPYDWGAVERLSLKAASFGVFMLDTISQDCTHLYDPGIAKLWTWTLQHADLIATTSELTNDQLARRFAFGAGVKRLRSLHSLDLADYVLPDPAPEDYLAERGYILVLGNHYWHKDVATTANALIQADPARRVVVLGGEDGSNPPVDAGAYPPQPIKVAPNLLRFRAGSLTAGQMSALYAGAAAVVAPSHYEGFGMPVLNALAAHRPVFVRPLPVVAELSAALGGDDNIHPYLTTKDLVEALAAPPRWNQAGASPGRPGDAVRAARDIGEGLDVAIADANYARIVRRLATLPSACPSAQENAPATPQSFVARSVAGAVERLVARILSIPGVFSALRRVVRTVRRLTGAPPSQAA